MFRCWSFHSFIPVHKSVSNREFLDRFSPHISSDKTWMFSRMPIQNLLSSAFTSCIKPVANCLWSVTFTVSLRLADSYMKAGNFEAVCLEKNPCKMSGKWEIGNGKWRKGENPSWFPKAVPMSMRHRRAMRATSSKSSCQEDNMDMDSCSCPGWFWGHSSSSKRRSGSSGGLLALWGVFAALWGGLPSIWGGFPVL